MSTVLQTKTKARKIAAAQSANRRTTPKAANYRKKLTKTILADLYTEQLSHWYRELKNLSIDNTRSQKRHFDNVHYGIAWGHKKYRIPNIQQLATKNFFDVETEDDIQKFVHTIENVYCLPLSMHESGFADRMQEIAEELDELEEETYEVERFLTNLFSFAAPPERFMKILGPTIGPLVKDAIEQFCSGMSDAEWTMNGNSEFALKTFVKSNKDTILRMNQRILVNLVTL